MDAETAIKLIDDRMCLGRGKWTKNHMPVIDEYWQAGMMAIEALTLPSADAVPVVRCKDCRYWDAFPSSSCAPEFHECKGLGVHTVADFFCSKGEEN